MIRKVSVPDDFDYETHKQLAVYVLTGRNRGKQELTCQFPKPAGNNIQGQFSDDGSLKSASAFFGSRGILAGFAKTCGSSRGKGETSKSRI
jgi:hypothetical protein